MNKEELHLLPESDRKGRNLVYTSTNAQQAVAGPPPAYSVQPVSAPTYKQPVGLSVWDNNIAMSVLVISFKWRVLNGNHVFNLNLSCRHVPEL